MTKDEITEWLRQIGKDREWLAKQTGAKKRTVDSWFSFRGFPPWAIKAIDRLRHEQPAATGTLILPFTVEQFEVIEEARHLLGDPPRPQFYHDGIMAFANEIIAAENKIEPFSKGEDDVQSSSSKDRVAEDEASYRAASSPKKRQRKAR